MALSGLLATENQDGCSLLFSWTATQSVANNISAISWKLEAVNSKPCSFGPTRITMNGATIYYNKSKILMTQSGTITGGKETISHNTDGTKSFIIKIASTYDTSSLTYILDSSYNSKTFTLNTIDRRSAISCSTLTMNSKGTINVTRKSTSLTHTITYTYGNASGTICEKSSSVSVAWTPPLSLAYQIPNATSGQGTLICTTYSGNTKIGSNSISFKCNLPSSVIPSVSASLTNTNTTFGCYAQNLSYLKVKPTASGSYGSTIKSIVISVTGMNDKTATNGTEYTFGLFSTTGTKSIVVKVIDSRGRSKTYSTSISVSAYSLPTAKVVASRGIGTSDSDFTKDDTGGNAQVTATGSVCSISGNTLSAVLKYRQVGTSSWTSAPISYSGLNLNSVSYLTLSDEKSFDIQLIVTDKAGKTATFTTTLSTGYATMDWLKGGRGIAFGKTATQTGFDCAMILNALKPAYFRSDSAGGAGQTAWYYNNAGTQTHIGTITAYSDGLYINAPVKGYLVGTWSGTASDKRLKCDIEPIAQNIINAVGEVPFVQFRMMADGYDHDELCVGILAQDLKEAFERHGVKDKLLMLDNIKLKFDGDEQEYYCVEYTHFLLVRLLYDELKLSNFNSRLSLIEKQLNIKED